METKEVKLYVQAVKYSWKDNFEIDISTMKRSTDTATTAIQLSEVTVEIEIPNIYQNHLNLSHVEQLREAIKTEHADSYARITAIEEKIQSLLCIEQGE